MQLDKDNKIEEKNFTWPFFYNGFEFFSVYG